VVSVDINSGLNGDSGLTTLAVKSDLTVSIGTVKGGLVLGMARDYAKNVVNCNIGIEIIDTPYHLIEENDVKSVLKARKSFSNKGDFGYVALIGGCMEYSGAIKLANLALSSLKTGAGVTKLATARSIYPSVSPYLVESTFYPLSDRDGKILFKKKEIDSLLRGVRAVAIGMGIGNSKNVHKILVHILKNYDITVIIDADGLNSLAKYGMNILKETKCNVILTPHPKEMERLSGVKVTDILSDPINIAKCFANEYNLTLLLKGSATVVSDGKDVYISDRGCSGMATAGSGDVLSGVILGICAQNNIKEETPLNVVSAAFINGMAGEIAQMKSNEISMTALDTVNSIAEAISKIKG
jgi:NAD(P)H-hydrate epimerase